MPCGGMPHGQRPPPDSLWQGPPLAFGVQTQYCPPVGGYGNPPPANAQAPPCSNKTKQFVNWNVCYSCGFDVADGHTSMTCPANLHKALHDVYFMRQNAQQYINWGHPCYMKNRHKTQMPSM
jgi:hypothetical protein